MLVICMRFIRDKINLGDSPANLFKSTKVSMATPQARCRVPHTQASLEPRTSGFPTLSINHYATPGFLFGSNLAAADLHLLLFPASLLVRTAWSSLVGWLGD